MLEILSYKMSSVAVERPTKMNAIDKKENENNKTRKIFNNSHKKHNKHEENRHFKFGRKRSQSFTGNSGKFFPPYKRRKKEGHIVPPTKFLLGGNICDPLNLNSMQDEEVNRAMNAVTPISSPLPTPKHRKGTIEVIIPPNIHDPLNLINCNDNDEYEKQLISPVKKNTKKKKKKKFKKALNLSEKVDESIRSEESVTSEKDKAEDNTIDTETPDAQKINSPSKLPPTQSQEIKAETQSKEKNKLKLKGLDEIKDKRLRKLDSKDKIVSPVIPQPGMFGWKSRTQHYKHYDRKKKNSKSNFHSKNVKFPYGNYLRYYGYRNPDNSIDSRLKVFAQRKRLFFRKDILDIGCNIGHITISIARDFGAKSVTGIDIDKTLTNIARTNIKHYVNCIQSPVYNENGEHKARDANFFPISMPINYGPIDIPGFTKKDHKGFPHNVTFVQGNYVLENDSLLTLEQPQFDVILCLSVTKWVHLNFGDEGLKTSFKRMYAQLRPGGVLLLEPQAWDTYQKRKHLSEQMCINYHKIELRPENFTQYLLSPEVGFSTCEVISVPPNPSKGFQRPIYLYEKAISRRQNSKDLELEQKAYERSLFPASSFCDNASTSQRSIESITQYEQLENVYAPCATPCFTPLHNTDSLSADLDLKCVEPDSTVKSEEDLNVQKISPKIETNENSSENTAIVTTTTINCTDSVIEQKFENCETQDDKT